jgi:hypothetical protein
MRKSKSGSADSKPSDKKPKSANGVKPEPPACEPPCDYEVGYGKPPKNTRFVKGRSGNPKGSAGRATDAATEFRKIAEEKIEVVIDGKKKRIRAVEGTFLALRNKALKGDIQAQKLWIALTEKYAPDLLIKEVQEEICTDEDMAIILHLLERGSPACRDNMSAAPAEQLGEPNNDALAKSPLERDDTGLEATAEKSVPAGQKAADGAAVTPEPAEQEIRAREAGPAVEPCARDPARRGRSTSSTYLKPLVAGPSPQLRPAEPVRHPFVRA